MPPNLSRSASMMRRSIEWACEILNYFSNTFFRPARSVSHIVEPQAKGDFLQFFRTGSREADRQRLPDVSFAYDRNFFRHISSLLTRSKISRDPLCNRLSPVQYPQPVLTPLYIQKYRLPLLQIPLHCFHRPAHDQGPPSR